MSTQVSDLAAPQWTFGDRIRKIRRDEKLTQAEFAEMIGRKDKAVGAWESGLNEPDDILSVARRIQEEFHVPATWVLGLDAPPPSGGGGPIRARPEVFETLTFRSEGKGIAPYPSGGVTWVT